MKFTTSSLALLAATGAQAHYNFPKSDYEGTLSADWTTVRKTDNYNSHGPVQDVSSGLIRCYQSSFAAAADTVAVKAGTDFTFTVDPSIQHPGPLQFYLAKVPSGQTAATFDGSGDVWVKIYQDGPSGLGTASITWPSSGASEVTVKIPSCVEDGDYLLRVEHIALHSASQVGGAQFYLACAQLSISGGSGTLDTSSAVSFPGAYSAQDPGILFQLYYPVPTEYINPGPAVVSC